MVNSGHGPLRLLLLSIAYIGLLQASLLFNFGPDSIALFWPANGFLVGVLAGAPSRLRPGVFAFAFAVMLASNLIQGKIAAVSFGLAMANLAECAIALWSIGRLRGRGAFLSDLDGTVKFFLAAVPAAAAGGGAICALTMMMAYGKGPLGTFATWLLVDGAGLAVVAPAYLAWVQRDLRWDANRKKHAEFAACAALALGMGYVVFAQPAWADVAGRPLPYATFPFLMWAAIRFGARGAATVHLGLYLLATWYASRGHGPFLDGRNGVAASLHFFPYAAAFCSLVPAVLIQRLLRAEANLKAGDARFGSLWKSRLVGIFVSDFSGNLVDANDTFLELLGYTREELAAGGLNVLRMATPEYLSDSASRRERFARDGMLGPFEREWIRKDGGKRISLAYYAKMDEPDRALGMVMDMNELKLTHERLRQRESRYRDLLSSGIMGVFVTDLSGQISEANDAFLGMIKRSRVELESGLIHSRDMVTPEYLSGAEERRARFAAEGRMGPYDREWKLHDGSRLHTLFFATRMEGSGNALCMVFDINELKRTKLELRQIESRFKALFDSNVMGVAVVGENQVFTEANDTFLAMTGYSRTDLAMGMINSLALRAERPSEEADPRSRAAGKSSPRETWWRRKEGAVFPVFRGVARLDIPGHHLLVALDLSELKRVQGELVEAREAADAANQAKSDFLAHMSHEIRTPLNGVLGMLSLLSETELDAEQSGYARGSMESGSHLLGLINQILDFSKIERGHLELECASFTLEAVVDGAFTSVMDPAQKKGLDLVLSVDPDLPRRFLGDAVRLQQVLLNLVGNAVKFSSRGEVRLSVRRIGGDAGAVRLEFEVADQGPGIPPDALPRLFRPFSQGDGSMARKSGGTGLGLAISREIARKMGGDIGVESRPGEGSVFRFTVALEPAPGDETAPGAPAPGAAKPIAWILESQTAQLEHLRGILSGWGFEVHGATDSGARMAQADDAIREDRPPDLAILGVAGAEGVERAEQFLQSARRLDVPALCILPFGAQGQGPALMRAGASGILTRPFRASDVLAAVRTALPKWQGTGAGEATRPASPAGDWTRAPRVLVVDDHPVNLTVAGAMLAKLGCFIDTAVDGEEALAAAKSKTFDLIFMDCQMPGMDGFETTRLLRAGETGGRRTPIVALTAHAVAGVRERCLAEGMDDYLTKPFTAAQIARMLALWIPAISSAAPAREPEPPRAGLIDPTRLEALADGTPSGGENARRLVELFLDTSRTSLASLGKAREAGDRAALAKGLHRLKGSCATLGATAMASLAAELESRLDALGPEGLGPGLEELEGLLARTDAALRELRPA